jgi:uncharacterized glyoxalase superfamily protein PhnB
MKFMILVKATADSEAGVMPTQELLTAMGAYNEALVKAGIMQAGEGLHPSSKGARVRFSGNERTVVDGPFAETKELVAGFWMWKVKSRAEAIEWVKRCPNPMLTDSEIEIRQVFEAEDFGAEFTPELREQEDRLRAQINAVPPVPPVRGAIPYLTIKGASDAIGFYQKVFGAEVVVRLDAPDGTPMHVEMKVGPAHFMLTEERPQFGALGPLTIGGSASTATLYFPDVDPVFAAAVAAGAKSGMPLMDQFWGDRTGSITDPFGHQWMLSSHKEDPSLEQLHERLQKMFAQMPKA